MEVTVATRDDIIDLSKVEPEEPSFAIPSGQYLVKVHEASVKEGEKGPYVSYGVTILKPSTATDKSGKAHQTKGRRINFQSLFLTEATRGHTVGLLHGMVGAQAASELPKTDAYELAKSIARLINGATFVAGISTEKATEAEKAKGYDDRNRVRKARSAETWADVEGKDLPF